MKLLSRIGIYFISLLVFPYMMASTVHAGDPGLPVSPAIYASADVVGDDLVVSYSSANGWELTGTYMYIGDDYSGMPRTRGGNPKIGKFPYINESFQDPTKYADIIPLSDLGFVCPTEDKSFAIFIHVTAELPDVPALGGITPNVNVKPGMWGTYFTVVVSCDNGGGCETAFGYTPGTNEHDDDPVTSFLELDLDRDGTKDFSRWGWTLGPFQDDTLQFPLYAGAAQSDISKGTQVGIVEVNILGGFANVEFYMNPPYYMKDSHVYVGSDILPKDDNGNYTVAPGQYPSVHELTNGETYDIHRFNSLVGPNFVVAHATVCGFEEEE